MTEAELGSSTATGKQPSALVNIETRQRIALEGDKLAVGRLPEKQLPLPDDIYVSSSHATIFFEGGCWWLSDLGSTNGTFKNNIQVAETVLIEPGDIITFGRTKFEVV